MTPIPMRVAVYLAQMGVLLDLRKNHGGVLSDQDEATFVARMDPVWNAMTASERALVEDVLERAKRIDP